MESSSKEKRSKYKEDTASQKGQMLEKLILSFFSTRQVPSMAMRLVTSGRCIIFTFLEELRLQLRDKIEEQGWNYFCSLNTLTYQNLVQTFYENLIFGEEHIESRVKKKGLLSLNKV